MSRFLVFLKNTSTAEEFVSPQEAPSHATAMMQAAQTYPSPQFKVHTAYAQQELENIMENLNRWAGAEADEVKKPVGFPGKGKQPTKPFFSRYKG